jgi:hypothetical protein
LTNVVLVARKLATLEDHVQRLRARRPEEVETMERDLLLQDAIATFLQRAGGQKT